MHTLLVLMLGLLLVSPAALAAQTLATVRGVVRDPHEAPVAGVRLLLVHEGTNERRATTSNRVGQFQLAAVPPGSHRLEVEQAGYRRYVQRLHLQVNQEVHLEVNLVLGTLAEQTNVTAPMVVPERLRTAVGTVLDARTIGMLPLDGRNFLELTLLASGTAPAAQGSAGSVRGDFAFHVNGKREDANSLLLDGVLNVDPKLNALALAPAVDAVQEFEIVTSTPDASFGRNSGGHVNVIVRSGSNRVNGSAYEFFRHEALNARNAFAPSGGPSPAYRRDQFGASIGGPIVRDRTFVFGDYEGTRAREGITRIANVPTLAERNGDFSATLSAPPVNPLTGTPFPGGRIPTEWLHPVGRAIAALYPAPNRDVPFQNFVSSPAGTDRRDQFDVRLDHVLSERSSMTVRYSFVDRDLYEPFSGPTFAAVPGFGTNVPRRAQNLMVGERRSIGSSLFSELRIGYTRVSAGAFHENRGTSVNRSVGLPELSADPRDWGLSYITISGYSPLGDEYNNPQHSTTDQVQVIEHVTWARGRHLFKIGGDVRVFAQDAYRDVQSRGFLTFSDQVSVTGNALADLLLGIPLLTGGARLDNAQRLRAHSFSLFAHDTLWLAPRLTLTAGLRYEYNAPAVDADDRANVFDPASGSLVQVGTDGVPRGAYAPDWNNLAPRVGVAWDLDGRGTTVLRAGYGVFYDQAALAPSEGLYFNPPYFDFQLYFPLPGLPLQLTDPFPQQFPLALPRSATAYQRDFRTAYSHQWNVNVQRQLGPTRVFEAAYVGSAGRSLLRGRDINQAPPSPVAQPRPLPQFEDITWLESAARADFDSLQLSFTQRLSSGVSALASYTWSSSHDDGSSLFASAGDPNFPQDSRNPDAEWARSSYDVRHRFSAGFTYLLPFGRADSPLACPAWLTPLVADWELTGVLTLQSGRPFTVALPPEFDNSNTGRSTLGFGANDRPNVNGNPTLANPGPAGWFDTSVFSVPPRGSFGNAGRNSVEGPGYANLNLALARHVRVGNAAQVQVRFEAFNVLNRTNLDLPDAFFGSPTFGQVLSAQPPRRVQLGAKLLF